MGWLSRKILCKRCEAFFTPRDGKRFHGSDGLGICLGCLDPWRRNGCTCVICQRRVFPMQEIGYFSEQKGFGHYDCGGMRIDG